MELEIKSYVGVGPIKLGMSRMSRSLTEANEGNEGVGPESTVGNLRQPCGLRYLCLLLFNLGNAN